MPARNPMQGQAILRGRVLTDSSELPIPDVRISLGAADVVTAQSDSSGRYRIGDLRPGRYTILVRRLGFAPVSSSITLAAGDSIEADFVMTPIAQELASVEVTTTVLQRKLRDFEDRRRFGIGRFMTEEDIRKAPGHRMSEKLRELSGIRLLYSRTSSNDVQVASSRGSQSIMLQSKGPCLSSVMVDGLVLAPPFSVNWLDPGEVAAIEWYAGPASMPAQFNSTRNGCGLLVIWTK
jgi:hypothetical protein